MLEGEGEEQLFNQMITCLWNMDDEGMFMIVLPNKKIERAIWDPASSSRKKFYSKDCLDAYNRF